MRDWQPKALVELGDFIGKAILLICEDGAFEGGLRGISETDLHIETGEGIVMAIPRTVLASDLTELYVREV